MEHLRFRGAGRAMASEMDGASSATGTKRPSPAPYVPVDYRSTAYTVASTANLVGRAIQFQPLVAVAAFGLVGYLIGRLRQP